VAVAHHRLSLGDVFRRASVEGFFFGVARSAQSFVFFCALLRLRRIF